MHTSVLDLEAASWRGVNCHRSRALAQAFFWSGMGGGGGGGRYEGHDRIKASNVMCYEELQCSI